MFTRLIHSQKFTFDDVLILPNYSTVKSRKDCDTKLVYCSLDMPEIPIIAANMYSIGTALVANRMSEAGGMGTLHRFWTIEQNVMEFQKVTNKRHCWVSIGVGETELKRAEALLNAGALNFIIDIAHGASLNMVQQYTALRNLVGEQKDIMVGNFGSPQSVLTFLRKLEDFYGGHKNSVFPNFIKLGLGSGANCTTRSVTGVGYPQFSLVYDTYSLLNDHPYLYKSIKLVSDGGINKPADFCKALAAGADIVMMGKTIASCEDSTEHHVTDAQGIRYNEHYGSASEIAYKQQNKVSGHRTAEGEKTLLKATDTIKNTLQMYQAGLKSSMSYVGANYLGEYAKLCNFLPITNNGIIENGVRK